ncbi:hypothetical protein TSAR_007541 [Trichomalopsis sarcophagae]|uniref:Uncharacterized protein n=1 Tax=Trichomalopsis sarcophagae TaxID=543379 RepID=A0A232EG02_9HYME|nr:hypothetical protein TSAR_007541 [Trichomalopsis sarcophagae]
MLRRKKFSELGNRQKKRRIAYISNNLDKADSSSSNQNLLLEEDNKELNIQETLEILGNDSVDQDEISANSRANNLASNKDDYFSCTIASTSPDSVFCSSPFLSLASWVCQYTSWVCQYSIPHNAINDLLKRLKTWPKNSLDSLPSDVRTLLNTHRKTTITTVGIGQYMHFGLEKGLIHQLQFCLYEFPIIYIDIHVDGIPLWKSRNLELIPISGRIVDPRYPEPFLIGAYYGQEKAPNTDDFLSKFVIEYNALNTEGFDYYDKHYLVEIRAVIADTVARNWIMCHAKHNSKNACQKCTQIGTKKGGRMLMLDLNAPLKNDFNFRELGGDQFKNIVSPLEGIGIGMVSQIPLDAMHLLYMGIMKKLMGIWVNEYDRKKNSRKKSNRKKNSRKNQVIPPKIKKFETYRFLEPKPASYRIPHGFRNPYSKIKFDNFQISDKNFNNCCYLSNGEVVLVQYISYQKETPVILSRSFLESSSIPDYPCDSELLFLI